MFATILVMYHVYGVLDKLDDTVATSAPLANFFGNGIDLVSVAKDRNCMRSFMLQDLLGDIAIR